MNKFKYNLDSKEQVELFEKWRTYIKNEVMTESKAIDMLNDHRAYHTAELKKAINYLKEIDNVRG